MILQKLLFTLLLFICSFQLSAEEPARPTVCLNMIVKNESKVIRRCLKSLLPIIDTWVIVDTGSTDGTQKIIQDFMKQQGVPGELYERPWKNFGHNRNEALSLAKDKADYILFIDADEYMTYEKDFSLPKLDKDFYYIAIDLDGHLSYQRIQMISTKKPWQWVGAVHEVLQPSIGMTSDTIPNITITSTRDGARSQDPLKYEKDAKMLEQALIDEPNNTRYMFYLAQSYRDAEKPELALQYYEKRIAMGGWEEEVFWSKLQVGILHEQLKSPREKIIECYKEAFQYRPSRVEPLYYLANYLRRNNDFRGCYEVAKIGTTISVPKDVLFTQKWMYDYGILLECSVGAYWIGKYKKCQTLSHQILQNKSIPKHVEECVVRNLDFANSQLLEVALSKSMHGDKKN